MSKITHEQAIALWNLINLGPVVGVDSEGVPHHNNIQFWIALSVLTAGRPRKLALRSILRPKQYDPPVSPQGHHDNQPQNERAAVAAFLREFADAIEGS